jgi:hypothetical protein
MKVIVEPYFKGLHFCTAQGLTPRTQFFMAVNILFLQLHYLAAISTNANIGFDPQIAEVVNPKPEGLQP